QSDYDRQQLSLGVADDFASPLLFRGIGQKLPITGDQTRNERRFEGKESLGDLIGMTAENRCNRRGEGCYPDGDRVKIKGQESRRNSHLCDDEGKLPDWNSHQSGT